jgi:hypothetical protein
MRVPRTVFPVSLITLVLLVVALAPLAAQGATAGPSAEEQEVLATVTRLFDGMRARDTAMIRSTFAAGAELKGVGMREGKPGVAPTSADEFIRIVGSATGPQWDERIHHTEVRIDGGLASVWTGYDFYLGDKFSHCGVDAFHLARFPEGWKIIALADTRRREGCQQGR